MTFFYGTKHPYQSGDEIVPGLVGLDEYGDEVRVWASTRSEDAWHAADHRHCLCGDGYGENHRPRVFEVTVEDPGHDPCAYTDSSVMAAAGRIVCEVPRTEG